jgi:AraC-like DNA-binding protein
MTRKTLPLYRAPARAGDFASIMPRVLLAQESWHGGRWVLPAYRHPFYTLSLLIEGHAKITVKGADHVRTPGSVLLFSPGVPYQATQLSPDRVYHSFILSFVTGSKETLPVDFADARIEPVRLAMEQARRLCAARRLDHVALKTLVLEILSHAYAVDPVVEAIGPRLARRTREYLEAHLGEPFSLARLAALENLGSSRYAHLFKKATGVSPRDCFLSMKLSAAKQLLLSTHDGVAEVSEKLGFSSVHHFTKFFASHAGTPPATWRRNMQGKHPRPRILPIGADPTI